jgi:hypothetical protein
MPLLLALALGAAAAQDKQQVAAEPPAAAKKLIEDCNAHRFETTIKGMSKGKLRESKVKLCGTPGQTDAEWITTLKDAVAKVTANPAMAPSAKQQIITAVNAEIVRLGAIPPAAAPSLVGAPGLANSAPLPTPRRAPGAAGPQYSALPAFPPPIAAKPVLPQAIAGGATVTAAPFVAPLPRPRLTITCFSDGDLVSDGPCFKFDRHTRITVRAGEPLKDTLLRFVRDGEERADYVLPPLTRGRSASFALPREVCAHAVGGNLSVKIVRGPAGKPQLAQVVGTEGPYNLTC